MVPKEITVLLQQTYYENTVENYLVAVGIFVATFIVLMIVKSVVLHRLRKLAKLTKLKYDDIAISSLLRITKIEMFIISLYVASRDLTFHKTANTIITTLAIVIIVVRLITIVSRVITEVISEQAVDDKGEVIQERSSAARNINILIKVVLWAIGILFILNNLGVNITAAVAGLGIGGIAIALAAQSVLGDAFSSFAIFMDKPFVVGDFIIVDKYLGVVEHIGIKTTRVKSLQGEQLIFSNTDLTKSRIQNFKKMERRRVPFTLGVTYQTPPEKLKKIPDIIKEIVARLDKVEFDRAHFKAYGDFSLNFEIVYYINTADYNEYMDAQQCMNLEIFEAFAKEGIEFAYPTQTVFVEKS